MNPSYIHKKTGALVVLSLLVFILGSVNLFLWNKEKTPEPNLAHVYMLDVGQGDSFLIEAANGNQILIDGGRDEKVLTELADILPLGDRSINVVIATHSDADHIGGLPLVLERYNVDLFLTSEVFTDTEVFQSLYQVLKERKIPSYYARRGMMLSFDKSLPTTFTILFPDRSTSNWETNAASIVGRLDIGERSALFTGDSPSSIERFLVATDPLSLDVDILKVGHHGSKTSSSAEFLQATTPVFALISAGKGNRYGHPAPEITNRLAGFGIPFVSTQSVGTYTLSTDGVKWFEK